MPRVKHFLHNELPQYSAAYVDWIGGHSPEVHFLNVFKKTVKKQDISDMDEERIRALLAEHGIEPATAAPTFRPPEFTPTKVCVAWRQTGNCNPNGEREPNADESCGTEISNGRSGFCECVDKPRVDFGCEHTPFTCEVLCSLPPVDDAEESPGFDEDDAEEL